MLRPGHGRDRRVHHFDVPAHTRARRGHPAPSQRRSTVRRMTSNTEHVEVRLAEPRPPEPTAAQILASVGVNWPPNDDDLRMLAQLRLAARAVR